MTRLTPEREAEIRRDDAASSVPYPGLGMDQRRDLLAELDAVRAERDAALARQARAIADLSWPNFLSRYPREMAMIELAKYLDDVLYSLKGRP